jgi:uncharacterized membrane protein YesL/GNAT superfamily N-acetyltransferase
MEHFLEKHHSKFNQVMETIYKLVIINFLSIVSTVLGIVIFGFFPSLMTAYILIRRVIEKDDFPIFKTYKETFKQEFIKANKVGYVFAFVWLILALSWFFYLNDLNKTLHQVGLVVVGFMAIAAFLMTCYLPISYAYFKKLKTFELVKFCLIIVFGMPVTTLLISLSTLFFYAIVMIRFITIFPFLAISLPAFVNMLMARKKLLKLFTVYTDEHVTIRSLNSYFDLSNLWHFIEEEIDFDLQLTYEKFQYALNNNKIDFRHSLIGLDDNDKPIGLCLLSKESSDYHIIFILVAKGYQRRHYGRKMIETIEKMARQESINQVILGNANSFYEDIPKSFYKYLSFFKRLGFQMQKNGERYEVHKIIGGDEQ